MATDSTELTFVRCPSCRSLVPAVSTRCRMCGASLDAAGKTQDEDDATRKSGRVRQRTMSTKQDDALAEARDRARRASLPGQEDGKAELDREGDDGEFDEADPLSAYLEESEEEEESVAAVTESGSQTADEEEVEPERQSAGAAPRGGMPTADKIDSRRPIAELKASLSESRPAKMPERASDASAAPARGSDKPYPEPQHGAAEEAASRPGVRPPPAARNRELEPAERPARAERKPLFSGNEPARERLVEPRVQEPAGVVAAEEQRPAASVPPPVKQTKMKGRLFGWLVSYSDPEGVAMELREGKFFVTRSRLKPSDLLIEHESVSTPHALAIVDAEQGFRLQDLMSERGIFLRKRGMDTYRREEDLMVVENGDWVRIGDLEFLVSLVPYPGVK